MEENTQGNPEAVEETVFGSEGDSFFESLEAEVNGGIQDDSTQNVQNEATPVQQDPSRVEQQAAQVSQEAPEIENLKKRYSDSSREAQKMRAQLNELQPFMPVLEAMKKDGNLVEHVRGYFNDGGNVPKDIKSQLNLPEDFEFDPDEMVTNPESGSRKVFESMVGNIVNERANEIVGNMKAQEQKEQYDASMKTQAVEFIEKHGLTRDEFSAFMNEAQNKLDTQGMTFDDMYLIMNQNKVNQNVANATKKDMLNQMKNVRDIPTSQSGANSKSAPKSQDDGVFEALKNLDGGLDDMFG